MAISEPKNDQSRKRKGGAGPSRSDKQKEPRSKKARYERPSRQRDARVLATQTSFKAFRNGELDVDKFVRSREYEIQALEQGLVNSKKALTKRAFQQVPKDLRRRTASHNVKRVPKRLQTRAKREMKEDNTPTVIRKKRKQTSRMRLRSQTAVKLRLLSKGKADRKKSLDTHGSEAEAVSKPEAEARSIIARAAKVKDASAESAVIHRKFRKRQKHKAWLPTHLYHAKRARMTPPSQPIWGFAVPLTPTVKSYRPTHRAASERGAIAWDTSYVSTILLTGVQSSILNVLTALGMSGRSGAIRDSDHKRWLSGCQVLDVLLHEREAKKSLIGPATLIWQALTEVDSPASQPQVRSMLVRLHPSSFPQLWIEITRASKVAKPAISIEDLRYQVGSLEVVGPEATQALASVLWPYDDGSRDDTSSTKLPSALLQSLKWLTNTSVLPSGALLSFETQDPRLHFPPRKQKMQDVEREQEQLLQIAADWPRQPLQSSTSIFDKQSGYRAAKALATQRAIARRKAAAGPGKHLEVVKSLDPAIGVLLHTSAHNSGSRKLSKWTVLLPWKCILPVWYSLMYTPLASGNQPRLGGLDETRTLALEQGDPWFPADFPATKAGYTWELQQRKLNKAAWERRPKSKRINWDTLDLGLKTKGEIGSGYACDWMQIFGGVQDSKTADDATQAQEYGKLDLSHIGSAQARLILNGHVDLPSKQRNGLFIVRIKMVGRGLPEARARIYRLPTDPIQKSRWLKLCSHAKITKSLVKAVSENSAVSVQERHQRLARSLLEPSKQKEELPCPSSEDLIGFVTSGDFDLGAGQGLAIGSLAVSKLTLQSADSMKDAERLCVIRNVGNTICRLARWDVV